LSLGLVRDLADEGNKSLDLVRMTSLLTLDDDSCSNNLGGHNDVNQQSLTGLRRNYNWRQSQEMFELGKGLVGLLHLLKMLISLQ